MKQYTIKTQVDKFTDFIDGTFEYKFTGESVFEAFDKPTLPDDFSIGLIVGASGSGKSLLLKEFGQEEQPAWDPSKAIISHFSTPEEAVDRLMSVGLSTIPTWVKPYHVLSMGEKFRANLSRQIKNDAVVDEFTSVVDRNVAKASCVAVSKYIRRADIKRVVFASCHHDIIPWLCPDWVFDTATGQITDGRLLRRPQIELRIHKAHNSYWGLFKRYHYLTASLNKAARCYVAVACIDGVENLVAFTSVLPQPSGTLKNAWREHRTVVLPDFQGLGIGTRLVDKIASMYVDEGKRFFSRMSNVVNAKHRDASGLWKRTSSWGKAATPNGGKLKSWVPIPGRICYSYEYTGGKDVQRICDGVRKSSDAVKKRDGVRDVADGGQVVQTPTQPRRVFAFTLSS